MCFSFLFSLCRFLPLLVSMGILTVWILLVIVIGFVNGNLRSWICGTCAACHPCPPCSPQLNVSPQCVCKENLNNCNCNCVTHESLHRYHQEFQSRLLAASANVHSSQVQHHNLQRQFIISLLGLCLLNLILLLALGFSFCCAASLRRRYAAWRANVVIRRRQKLLKQLHMPLELSSHSHGASSAVSGLVVSTVADALIRSDRPLPLSPSSHPISNSLPPVSGLSSSSISSPGIY